MSSTAPVSVPVTQDALWVAFDRPGASKRIGEARGQLIGRVVSLGITIGIGIALGFALSGKLDTVFWVCMGISFGISLVLVIIAIVKLVRARGVLKDMTDAPAFVIDRLGLSSPNGTVEWPMLGSLTATPRRGGTLTMTGGGRTESWPVSSLASTPAEIDAAVFAYSAGRHRVDFSALRP